MNLIAATKDWVTNFINTNIMQTLTNPDLTTLTKGIYRINEAGGDFPSTYNNWYYLIVFANKYGAWAQLKLFDYRSGGGVQYRTKGVNWLSWDYFLAGSLKGEPFGLATLDSNRKLVQMPTIEDVGANGECAVYVLDIGNTGSGASSGEITITLEESSVSVEIGEGSTAEGVANLIRLTTFDGWATTGTGTQVIFTANDAGFKINSPSFSGGITGVESTFSINTVGGANGKADLDDSGKIRLEQIPEVTSAFLEDYTTISSPRQSQPAWNYTTHKPVYYNGTVWIYADGTPV